MAMLVAYSLELGLRRCDVSRVPETIYQKGQRTAVLWPLATADRLGGYLVMPALVFLTLGYGSS